MRDQFDILAIAPGGPNAQTAQDQGNKQDQRKRIPGSALDRLSHAPLSKGSDTDRELAGICYECTASVTRTCSRSPSCKLSTVTRADHSAPARTIMVAKNAHNMMLMDWTKGGTSARSLARSQGQVRMLMYLHTSRSAPTAMDTGMRRRTRIRAFGSSQYTKKMINMVSGIADALKRMDCR